MTITPAKHGIQQGPQDDDTLLHGQSIGMFPSELQARTALNRVMITQLHNGVAPEPDADPCDEPIDTPPSFSELETPLPVPPAALEAAAARLRPDAALKKALARLLEGGWSYTDHDETGLLIRFDPRSKGRGTKRPAVYTTNEESCTCPGAAIRGACYHPLAWQIVSEARMPTTSLQVSVPYATLLPLCRLALSSGAEHVTLTADSLHTTITLGVTDCVTGTIHVEMRTAVLLTIEQHLHAADLRRVIDALPDAVAPDLDLVVLDLAPTSLVLMAGPADAPQFFDGIDAATPDQHDHPAT